MNKLRLAILLIVIGVASTSTAGACPQYQSPIQENVNDSSSHLSLTKEDYIMGSAEKIIEYKGHEIKLKQIQEDVIEAKVGKKKFKIGLDKKKEKFSSTLMPYQLYDDLDKLTRDILDHHPDFREKKQ